MVEIRIPGARQPAPVGQAESGLGLAVTVKETVDVAGGRAASETVTIRADPDDLVELQLEGGAVLWLRADELAEQTGAEPARGSGGDGAVTLSSELPITDQARGIGAWSIDALRILGVDLAKAGAEELAQRFERKAVPEPGLYHWTGGRPGRRFEETAAGENPWLVFIHGTASNTANGFGDLAPKQQDSRVRQSDLAPLQPPVWGDLTKAYAGRILAFEHRTLTLSPIANAIELARALPVEAEVHLVSHSRGGLVGELLGRGRLHDSKGVKRAAFDAFELDLFEDRTLRDEAKALGEVLESRRLNVSRFVRVACPARGTSLIGGKLDRWLTLLFNVLKLTTGDQLNPVVKELLDALMALTRGIVKARTNPAVLPGLAAMSPEYSPLLRVLNRPDVVQSGPLQVIAGDAEDPRAVLRRLALWFADLYFGQDHDFVVDTASMDGGTPRQPAARFFSDKGPSVSHFSYFANGSSLKVLSGSLGDQPAATDLGAELSRAAAEKMPQLAKRGRGELPVVFVLPGFTGTHLKAGGDRIWIDILQLAVGGLGRLAIAAGGVKPDELVARYYGGLCRYLDAGHEVRPWPYDWRRSILATAKRFADDLEQQLNETDRPVRIVAHSMGGLVARAALAGNADLARRFRSREGSRLVMLGTPNGGSFSIPMLLLGRDRLMRWLAMLDIRASALDQLKVVCAWPGVVQMLPRRNGDLQATGGLDLFARRGWQALAEADGAGAWEPPPESVLAEARRLREVLDGAEIDRERMLYVAGQADTYDSLRLESGKVTFGITGEGDGRALWRTGIPDGMRAWYTTAAHGDLARHEPAFPAILDLLQRGTTELLPRTKPIVSRPRRAPASVEAEAAPIIPGEDLLLAASMGASPWVPPPVRAKVTVRVVHGHLKHARHPVLVGHYIGDTLNGSELMLDREQKGRISRRRDRGLHPGPVETFEVHLDTKQQPPGSVVVGLGDVSELTGGMLRRTVRRGLLALASAMDERDDKDREEGKAGPPQPRGFSCVLIGSGGGVVAISDSVLAILRAVRGVNLELGNGGFSDVEIIETIEQRAINAWHAIDQRIGRAELKGVFVLDPQIEQKSGAWRQIGPADDPDWWTPITIRSPGGQRADDPGDDAFPVGDKDALHYVVLSGRARAEAFLVGTRRSFIENYVSEVSGSRLSEGQASPARTLFELLWPNRLKEHSLDDRNIRLCLDARAAALPWEMMDDRRPWLISGQGGLGPEQAPPAVRHGVIRQLVEPRMRETISPPRGRPKALVIGDPCGAGSALPKLQYAREEAGLVAEALRGRGYDVTALIGDGPGTFPGNVVTALFSEAWQIIHIAGHGVVDHPFEGDSSGERKTGIVLGGTPDTHVLDPQMLEQMPVTPDLVFVNCCSLGTIDPGKDRDFLRARRPALASSTAVQLIRLGVRAVVAAGWEISDALAGTFAQTLYDRLLAGESYGNAVRIARAEVYQADRTSTTWGAYQCYGHPDYRLPRHEDERRHPAEPPVYAMPAEATSAIQRIVAMAGVGGDRDAPADLAELARIEEAVAAKGWLAEADIRFELGRAYADLGKPDAAIQHYTAALAGERCTAPILGAEQMHNLRVRREDATADAIISAIESLEALVTACGPSLERLSLIGSACKRLAGVQDDEGERTEALERMHDAYERARKLGQTRGLANTYYPWSQELTAQMVLGLRAGKRRRLDVKPLLSSLQPAATDDFWRRVLPADLEVLKRVADGQLTVPDLGIIVKAYKAVWKDTGSQRELASICEQIDFLIKMLKTVPGLAGLCAGLESLKRDLKTASAEV